MVSSFAITFNKGKKFKYLSEMETVQYRKRKIAPNNKSTVSSLMNYIIRRKLLRLMKSKT